MKNKQFAVITSMDQNYYKKIGKVMLTSYKHHWSDIMPMYVYNENDFVPKVKTINLMGWNLGQEYKNFMTRTQNSRVRTFAKKAYSIIHAMKYVDCDRLIWLDADTMIKEPIPRQLLDLITPDDVLSTHFGVKHKKNETTFFSCETGFFVLNKRHPDFDHFLKFYEKIYNENMSQGLRRFYDGEVYGKTVQMLEKSGTKMLDLNPEHKHKTPMPRSIIAPYITHYKAGLKERVDFDNMVEPDPDWDDET